MKSISDPFQQETPYTEQTTKNRKTMNAPTKKNLIAYPFPQNYAASQQKFLWKLCQPKLCGNFANIKHLVGITSSIIYLSLSPVSRQCRLNFVKTFSISLPLPRSPVCGHGAQEIEEMSIFQSNYILRRNAFQTIFALGSFAAAVNEDREKVYNFIGIQ